MPDLPLHKLFPLLFMMTGPLRVVPGFVAMTRDLDASTRNRLARRGVVFAAIGVLLSVFVGVGLMTSWGASPPAVATAAGVLLFLTALQSVLGWPPSPAPHQEPSADRMALSPLAFPTILPPFAVGVLILFGAYFPKTEDQLALVGLSLAILAADYVALLYARQILAAIGASTLQVLGAVFGVLQLSLAIQMIVWGVKAAVAAA